MTPKEALARSIAESYPDGTPGALSVMDCVGLALAAEGRGADLDGVVRLLERLIGDGVIRPPDEGERYELVVMLRTAARLRSQGEEPEKTFDMVHYLHHLPAGEREEVLRG